MVVWIFVAVVSDDVGDVVMAFPMVLSGEWIQLIMIRIAVLSALSVVVLSWGAS